MKSHCIIRNSKPIRLSTTPSTNSSSNYTPDSKSKSKTSILCQSIHIKQDLLASNLLLYSENLSYKIPIAAKDLETVDQRLNLLRKRKTIISNLIKKNKSNREQERIIYLMESKVMKLEEENINGRSEGKENLFELQAFKRKSEGFEVMKRKDAHANIDLLTLSTSLQQLRKTKKQARNHLDRINEEQAEVFKEYADCQNNRKANRQSKERLKSFRDDAEIFGARHCQSTKGNELECLYLLKEDLSLLKKIYHDFRERNNTHYQDVRAHQEKIKAKLALIQLESRYIDDQRKKFLKTQAVFNEINYKLSKIITKAKKDAAFSQPS